MRFYSFSAAFLTLSSLILLSSGAKLPAVRTFQQFKSVFGKEYENPEIEALRESHFEASLLKMDSLNAQNPSTEFGINQYSDLVSFQPL